MIGCDTLATVRLSAIVLGLVCLTLAACAQPAYVSCSEASAVCSDGCVDLFVDDDNCGACGNECDSDETCSAGLCVPTGMSDACATGNGGCSADAFCMDIGGAPACLCKPGFTGSGIACEACAQCDSSQFASTPCTPMTDTVCTACSLPCMEGTFESSPCGPFADRACSQCTQCGLGLYTVTPCLGSSNAVCAPCELGCVSCGGPGASCFMCDTGFVLSNGSCIPAVCGNAVLESGEQCDDGDTDAGDGCSAGCTVEAGNYCFGEILSICRAGSCVVEPATVTPLGAAFELDGNGTASASGLLLTQRSMIRTTAPVTYPVVVEATVVYSGFDITYVGTRGDGLRNASAGDEPTNTLRARLSVTNVQLATGPGTTEIASTAPPFSPTPGFPYRVRLIDDGFMVSVEWINLLNLAEGVGLQQMSSYHGTDDRAFVGGGDQGAVTVSDIRVCSAPVLPVTSGLVAHYSAIPSWTVGRDVFDAVSNWQDLSGNGRSLSENGPNPVFSLGLIGSQKAGVDFNSAKRLATAPFALTTDVSVFAVIHHRAPAQWGAIAHHGSRDGDWSMEQNGTGDPNGLHWQTNNDNVNMNLTLAANTSYVMTGIFEGNSRWFAATPFDNSTMFPVSIVDASHTITAGNKTLFVGSSDSNEASNAAIGELVYFNRALNSVERDAVIAYLRALWRPQ
jgi:cysteine-rich repeat protein